MISDSACRWYLSIPDKRIFPWLSKKTYTILSHHATYVAGGGVLWLSCLILLGIREVCSMSLGVSIVVSIEFSPILREMPTGKQHQGEV